MLGPIRKMQHVMLYSGVEDQDSESPASSEISVGQKCGSCRGIAQIVVGSATLLAAVFLIPSNPSTASPALLQHGNTSFQTASELLESQAWNETIAKMAVHAVEASVKLGRIDHASLAQQLPPDWKEKLQQATLSHLGLIVRQLTSAHQHAHMALHKARLTADQADGVLEVLHALMDPRILDVGVEVGRSCTMRTPQELQQCLMQKYGPHADEFRKLREELLPTSLQVLTDTLKVEHLQLLQHHGAFKASGKFGAWRAELSMDDRRLKGKVPGGLNESLSVRELSTPALSADRSHMMRGPIRIRDKFVPLNWNTVGAPVVSTSVGLLFLCLMALLPGTGGMNVNRDVAVGLWGVHSAGTVAECLANIGFHTKGIVYFAPCMIDCMFLGLEVMWVFFDGRSVSAPRRIETCYPYGRWSLLTGLCGNCMATVTSRETTNSCDLFCATFGHKCTFAALAEPQGCSPRARYRCSETLPERSSMLCQCSTQRRLQPDAEDANLALPSNAQEKQSRIGLITEDRGFLAESNQTSHAIPETMSTLQHEAVMDVTSHKSVDELSHMTADENQELQVATYEIDSAAEAYFPLWSIVEEQSNSTDRKLMSAQEHPEHRRLQGIWPSNVAPSQFPNQCEHALATLEVTTSNQPSADSSAGARAQFLVGGVWSDPVVLYRGQINPGGVARARLLVAMQPTRVRITSSEGADPWGYQRVRLFGPNVRAVLLDSPSGVPLGSNQYWIGGDPARVENDFNVPVTFESTRTQQSIDADVTSVAEFKSRYVRFEYPLILQNGILGDIPSIPPEQLPLAERGTGQYRVEMITQNEVGIGRARTTTVATVNGVSISFRLGSRWTNPLLFSRGLDDNGNGEFLVAGVCSGRTYFLPERPNRISIALFRASRLLHIDPWSFQRIAMIDGPSVTTISQDNLVLATTPRQFNVGPRPTQTTTTTSTTTSTTTRTTSTRTTSTTTATTLTVSTSTTSTSTTSTSSSVTTGTFPPRDGPIECSAFTDWPAILGDACGDCTARVPIRCSDYCRSINQTCYHSASPSDDVCNLDQTVMCSQRPQGSSGMLCTCGYRPRLMATTVQQVESTGAICLEYSQWPAINVHVCGNCSALVPVLPSLPSTSSCNEYCANFDHQCAAAAVGSSQSNDPCMISRELDCTSSTEGLAEVLCKCVSRGA